MRRQKGLHVKAGLGGVVGVLQADGAGVAGQAAAIETILLVVPGLLLEVTDTGLQVEDAFFVDTRQTSGKTGFGGAILARTGALLGPWQIKFFPEYKGAAVAVPEAEFRVNQLPQRRVMNEFGPLRPSLERKVGRAFERKQRADTREIRRQVLRHLVHHAAASRNQADDVRPCLGG